MDSADGVLSTSVPEVRKSGERGLTRSSHVTITRVQLRQQRNKLISRPASLPAERLSNRSQVDENNARNGAIRVEGRGGICDQSIEEACEDEKPKSRASTHYRSTFIDTQTLRRTWDKQYKHCEISFRTSKATAGSSVESPTADASNLSTSVPASMSAYIGSSTTNNICPNGPYTIAVRPNRTLRKEGNVDDFSPVTTTFRAPRTLQPPPGTFYKPPSGSKAKVLEKCASANSAEEEEEEEEEDEEEELGLEIEVSVDEPLEEDIDAEPTAISLSGPQSPSSSPEELSQNQAKPVYPRLRPRHLQEVEHREAHFV